MAWQNKNLIPVSIRIEQFVIDDLKKESKHDMIDKGSYQKLANRILKAWVNNSEMPARYVPDPKKKKPAEKPARGSRQIKMKF